MIANKMEASQETCFWGSNPSLPPYYQTVCSEKESFHTVIFDFFKAYVEKLARNGIDIWGSGAISPRSQRHFKESDKMKA